MFVRAYILEENELTENTIDTEEYRKKGMKTILLWNTFFGDKNFYFGEGDIFRDCPVDTCKIFNDRKHMNVEDYDAILFHGNDLNIYDVPQWRKPKQLYVYVNLESPANRAVSSDFDSDYFNLTMTYRLDSDIPWTYASIEEIKSGKFVAPSRNPDWSAFRNSNVSLYIFYIYFFLIYIVLKPIKMVSQIKRCLMYSMCKNFPIITCGTASFKVSNYNTMHSKVFTDLHIFVCALSLNVVNFFVVKYNFLSKILELIYEYSNDEFSDVCLFDELPRTNQFSQV